MSIYDDLTQLVNSTGKCDTCNTAKGDWELRKQGNYIALKYKGLFVILHSTTVSDEPTVCENTVQMFGLDSNMLMSILGITK